MLLTFGASDSCACPHAQPSNSTPGFSHLTTLALTKLIKLTLTLIRVAEAGRCRSPHGPQGSATTDVQAVTNANKQGSLHSVRSGERADWTKPGTDNGLRPCRLVAVSSSNGRGWRGRRHAVCFNFSLRATLGARSGIYLLHRGSRRRYGVSTTASTWTIETAALRTGVGTASAAGLIIRLTPASPRRSRTVPVVTAALAASDMCDVHGRISADRAPAPLAALTFVTFGQRRARSS